MRKAFTLIELLVVVAIIGILVSLAFPVIRSVRNSAKTAAAKIDMQSIVNAVDEYLSTYRRMPVPGVFQGNVRGMRHWDSGTELGRIAVGVNAPGERFEFGWREDAGADQEPDHIKLYRVFISTLQGSNKYGLNARNEQYLMIQEGRPVGLYMDPWSKGLTLEGRPENRIYQIHLDQNHNNLISVGTIEETYKGQGLLEGKSCIVRCLGPNRKTERYMDQDGYDDIFSFNVNEDLLRMR